MSFEERAAEVLLRYGDGRTTLSSALRKLTDLHEAESATPDAGGAEDVETRADRILSIVASAQEPMSRVEIVTALRERGDEVTDPQVVQNLLTKLARTQPDRITRPRRGYYEFNGSN